VDMTLKNALVCNWQYFVKTRELLQLEKTSENSEEIEKSQKNSQNIIQNHSENSIQKLNSESQINFNINPNSQIQIIHHCLPFAIGSTYNLAALLGYFGDKKFAIGPLQTGLSYKDLDIDPSNFRSSISKKKFNLQSLLTSFMKILAQILRPILSFLSHRTLLKADKIIVINDATKNLLLEQKIPENKIQIIPPGLDLAKFQFLPKNKKINTNEINTNENSSKITPTFEIVSVGYLLHRKGLDLLIEAIKKLKIELEERDEKEETYLKINLESQKENQNLPPILQPILQPNSQTINLQKEIEMQNELQNENGFSKINLSKDVNLPKIHLNILGDGPQMENLKKLVLDYKLSENVTFVGFVDNSKVAEFYQKADVFVSMSRSESWGQMYLEAMACGVPIITTENVGSNEIIENGKTGILVPQESVESLIQNLKFLIQNPAKKLEIAQNARQELEQKYDWSKIIDEYEKTYQELLKT
jgi:glycosyltransferase involved in cell wall biosynthesis